MLKKFNIGRIPADRLRKRDNRDVYGIIHLGLNTYTDREWGFGDENPADFNPAELNMEAVAEAAKAGGLTGLILVCKHHDGFCLWPTKTTPHNISKSPWRNGQGDLVREFADACKKVGLDAGFYVSPWDRNHPEYGRPAYLDVYQRQLREIFSNYGPAFEAWFDGANGGDGYYGGTRESRNIDRNTYYDWEHTWQIIRDLQPNAAIFSDAGPDLRWVGNEHGFADPDAFGTYTPHGANGTLPAPGNTLYLEGETGHFDGDFYIPPECDVPLRPGWFYHAREDGQQRSVALLVQIYLNSVGNGGFMNLGLAPDKSGRITEEDRQRLQEFKAAIDELFANPVFPCRETSVENNTAIAEFGALCDFNLVELAEDLSAGEQICGYQLSVRKEDGSWTELLNARAIGRRRLKLLSGPVRGTALKIVLTKTAGEVQTLRIGAYLATVPRETVRTCDIRQSLHYQRLEHRSNGAEWICTWDTPVTLSTLVFTPDSALPPGTPDRYEIKIVTPAGESVSIATGEFSNIRANPIPQTIQLSTPVSATKLIFRATRMLISGENLTGTELGCVLNPNL